ncbi:hypothetical protein Tco_1382544, partial [Tanacetum coccineum]
MALTTSSRSRQVLAPVTTNQKEVAAAASETQVLEDETMEFTKEEVDALLNERLKGKAQFNLKVLLVLCHSMLRSLETDIQEKEQKERQKQTNPSTGWKGQSQKSSQLKKL